MFGEPTEKRNVKKKKKDNNQTAIKKVQERDHGSLDYDDRDGKG